MALVGTFKLIVKFLSLVSTLISTKLTYFQIIHWTVEVVYNKLHYN